MRKREFGKKLSRERGSREALFVSLVESLVKNRKINTTKAKAKAISGYVDKLVNLAKKDTLAGKRQVLKNLRGNKEIATILWKDIAKLFADKTGGYTRIVPLVSRKGDMAEMVRMEWTNKESKSKDENLSTKTKGN